MFKHAKNNVKKITNANNIHIFYKKIKPYKLQIGIQPGNILCVLKIHVAFIFIAL